jgi:hypothetical protein
VVDVADAEAVAVDAATAEPTPATAPAVDLWFVASADAVPSAGAVVVLDTTWTAPSPGTAGHDPRVVSIRDVAEQVLAAVDLIAETSGHLDGWAAGSGIVDRLTLRGTSFWYYVRLRHWAWLEERILWARILDLVLADRHPARIGVERDVEPALLDVLRLRAARDGLELSLPLEPLPEAPPTPAAAQPEDASATAAASASAIPSTRRRPSGIRTLWPVRVARRVRDRFRGPPPTEQRRLAILARIDRVRARAAALAAEPERRLLVVHEHARQRVETPAGSRSINPYLDPIVERLAGSSLDPIRLDIRAQAGKEADWVRIGGEEDARLLTVEALVPPPEPGSVAPTTPAPAGPVARVADPAILAWKDELPGRIEVAGLDLAPLLAATVAEQAALWVPGMTASIDRIERFLGWMRPRAVVLADEYHRQDWMVAASAYDIPVVAVQHGMIYPRHNGYIHQSRPPALHLADRTYVFGRWERDLLTTRSVYRPDEVVVGGSPRLDLVRLDPSARDAVRRELGVADGDRLVVVSGTWGSIYRRFHYPIALAALVDRPLPRVHVVVKLHPGEPDEGPYGRTIELAAAARGLEPPRVSTVKDIDLYRLLAAADAHLGIHSTVLTEAVVTRTPNLLADGLAAADLLGYVAAGVAIPVRDGGDLLAVLDRAGDAMREEDAAAFVAAHFEPGVASERIAADLLAWLT